MKFCYLLMISLLVISGCTKLPIDEKPVNDNPTARDMLKYKDADIFELDGYVYSNAEDVDWVEEKDYQIGDQIGEITRQSADPDEFGSGTANKLPVGTKIHQTDTKVYIAIVNGREIPYIKMVEG